MSEIFQTRLREAREAKKLSQGELAERAALKPAAISHFETGARRPSFDNLKKLADALNVSVDYLLGRDNACTSAGNAVNALFRDFSKLTSADQDALAQMAKILAAKKHPQE